MNQAVQAATAASKETFFQILRLFYGDPETGRDWMEEADVIGEVGRSTGAHKIPLLIEPGEDGGPGILTKNVVRLMGAESGKELYRHPKYHLPEMEIRSTEGIMAHWHVSKPPKLLTDMGLTHGVWARKETGEFENVANLPSYYKACQFVAFMAGECMRKP